RHRRDAAAWSDRRTLWHSDVETLRRRAGAGAWRSDSVEPTLAPADPAHDQDHGFTINLRELKHALRRADAVNYADRSFAPLAPRMPEPAADEELETGIFAA